MFSLGLLVGNFGYGEMKKFLQVTLLLGKAPSFVLLQRVLQIDACDFGKIPKLHYHALDFLETT